MGRDVAKDMTPSITIFPWGNEIEDFLDPIGLSLGKFCEEVTTQVSLSRALEFGDEPFWVCGEGVEHIPTLFFRR
jgi:hypothetical protein